MAVIQFFNKEKGTFEKEFRIAVGARRPDLIVQILDDENTEIDLTSYTVTFKMDDVDGTAKVAAAAGSLEDATTGKVKYSWGANDTDTAGVYYGQFTITSTTSYLVPNNTTQKLRIVIGAAV